MPTSQSSVSGVVTSAAVIKEGYENFKVEKTATGTYRVNFTPPFEAFACPGVSPIGNSVGVTLSEVSKKGFTVKFPLLLTLLLTDTEFSIQVIGE